LDGTSGILAVQLTALVKLDELVVRWLRLLESSPFRYRQPDVRSKSTTEVIDLFRDRRACPSRGFFGEVRRTGAVAAILC
jgi:hypothetical protein